MDRFSIDIWTSVAKFFTYWVHGKSLLWLCHNSRVGILNCYPFWTKVFPRLVPVFLDVRTQKKEHLGPFCMYIKGEMFRNKIRRENMFAMKRMQTIKERIKEQKRLLKNEEDHHEANEDVLKFENVFNIHSRMKLNTGEVKKIMKKIPKKL